jgi:hypothetical protein
MFSYSVRRVAFTTPQTPLAPSRASSTPRAITTHGLSYRCHQRRLSSSKPSSPADGSKGVAEGEAVPAHSQAKTKAQTGPASEKKSAQTSKRKNYTAKGKDKAFQALPSVPSTQHIAPQRMYTWIAFGLRGSDILQKFTLPLSSRSTAPSLSRAAFRRPLQTMRLLRSLLLEQRLMRSRRK